MKAPLPPRDGCAHLPDGVTEALACLPSLPLPAVPAATELQPPVHTKQMPALRRGTKVHTFCGLHRKVTTVTLSSCRTWGSGSGAQAAPAHGQALGAVGQQLVLLGELGHCNLGVEGGRAVQLGQRAVGGQ